MAKLGSYYGLCPLIESKCLLGISEDSQKGIVIVTLDKNVAGRYKLADQKQICCWKTKEKFSSPIIYDSKSLKYLAVFNQSYIKLWENEEENLDKLKKYKFTKPIYSVFSINENTFVLFQDGNFHTLDEALELRKSCSTDRIISESEQIDDVLYITVNNQFYIGLIVKSGDEIYLWWSKFNSPKFTFTKLKLDRKGFNLRGYIFHIIENSVHILTIWSDGKIFSHNLEDSKDLFAPGEVFATIELISTKYTVSMMSLDENYIAMFGANSNEEGAMLLIYNTQFKVVQSKQSFKLFTNGAKLWSHENNLLIPVGQNLAVIPFYLEKEQIAALIGSHKTTHTDTNDDVTIVQLFEVASWDKKLKLRSLHLPAPFIIRINDLLQQGLPESLIVEKLLLEIFKTNDIDFLSMCVNNFVDIPEKYLVKSLKYLIKLDENVFENQTRHASKLFPSELQPNSRAELIDKILSKSYSETLILPYLHSTLTLADAVIVLNYICFLWSEDSLLPSLNMVKTKSKLIEWCFVIIDASYQKLFLSKDNDMKFVLNQLYELIEDYIKSFEDLKYLSSTLNYFKQKMSSDSSSINYNIKSNSMYSIEQIYFY